MASPGFNKDHTRRPCVGQLVITDRETEIPLYCEEYNGSLLYKTQGSMLIDLLEEKGFKNGLLGMDAGFWTQDSLNTIEKKEDHFGYLIRVPKHAI